MDQPTAIVTGASSGIGRGVTRRLANHGWRVIACGRDPSRLVETCDGFEQSCATELWDLSDTSTIGSETQRIVKKHGAVCALVHCAGVHRLAPLAFLEDDDLSDLIELNIRAPILILRELLKQRGIQRNGRVVLIGSAAARRGVAGAATYAGSKSALSGFVRSMAVELAGQQVTVNCIEPGMVNTPLTESMLQRLPQSAIESLRNEHPLGFGEVDDVAAAVEFLLSPEARWITGVSLAVDGGYTAH